jgi:hypothetical protein
MTALNASTETEPWQGATILTISALTASQLFAVINLTVVPGV